MAEKRDLQIARDITRGVLRLLAQMDYSAVSEVTLRSGRRVDVMGIGPKGEILVVEIKSSLADFRADAKWTDYLDYCDRFYFAVAEDFPQEVLPAEHGLMIADRYEAAIVRPSVALTLNGSRRRNMTLRFARTAAQRWRKLAEEGG